MDCKPKVVLTCNAVRRGPKIIHLKDIVDTALAECAQNGAVVGNYMEVVTSWFEPNPDSYYYNFLLNYIRLLFFVCGRKGGE